MGAMVMGIDPKRVKHLRLCSRRGLGEHHPDHIELVGAPIDQVRKRYRRPAAYA